VKGWRRLAFATAVTIGVAGVGTVAGTAIARSAPAAPNAPAPCTSPGTPYNHVRMNPGPIALAGSLQAGQSVTWFAQALDGTLCVPGATIWMQDVTDVPGAVIGLPAAQCGGQTTLPAPGSHGAGFPVACTADSAGKVTMTYTVPSVIPDQGTLQVNGSNSSSRASVVGTNWYLYEIIYAFSTSPVAPNGSLAANQLVNETLQASGVGGTPADNFLVYLSLHSTGSQHGSVMVGTTPLTSTPQAFHTDGTASIQLTYTAPSALGTSGIDSIYAQSDLATYPAITATTSYDFAATDPIISIGDEAQVEGDGGPDILGEFDVTLNAPQTNTISVKYITVCGIGDKTCKEDYLQSLEPSPHTVTFSPGQVSKRINIKMYSYPASEPYNEGLFIQLLNPTSGVLGRSMAQGTLLGDDETTLAPILYAGDTSVVCGTSGKQYAVFTVTLSSPESSDVTFSYASQDGSAIAGTDYVPVSGLATIPAGSTSFHIQITILQNAAAASTKTYMVNITNASAGTTIERPTGVGTILNWAGQ
jgi:Calx-beta domain